MVWMVSSPYFSLRQHGASERGVQMRLIFAAFGLQPCQDITIDADGHRCFDGR
jgi:hypothetical protein